MSQIEYEVTTDNKWEGWIGRVWRYDRLNPARILFETKGSKHPGNALRDLAVWSDKEREA